ncbi:uncharacterized protein METZ01_LOCUS195035 [marine metagenome]|uniref:SWIM-type domain-containing protein n=1 Tax=marine metagenome TaxID=408172 RepID=A0A382DWR9_9ZZZZ
MTNRYTKRHSKIFGDIKSAPGAIPYITNLREWANKRVREYDLQRSKLPTIKTYKIQGSNNNIYTLTVRGNQKSCSCPGYQFRQKCKHAILWTPAYGRL